LASPFDKKAEKFFWIAFGSLWFSYPDYGMMMTAQEIVF